MINRVTHQTIQRSTLGNLQLNLNKMSDLQGRMSGGKIITKPSDDPGGTAQAMALRASQRATEQYARNADDGIAWLSTIDSAVAASVSSLHAARDLTVQGANSGAMGQTSRDAIATAIDGIRDALLSTANTSHLGRSVFAGTSNAGKAFTVTVNPDDTRTYAWTGTPGASVERRLTSDTTVRADADGSAVFGDGAGSVFALLDSIAADLRSGVQVGPRLTEIDTRMTAMLAEIADVGARYGQMELAQSSTQKTLLDLKGQLSAIEDVDLAEIIVEIQTQEVAYQAALGATARVLQPSLLDFLR
ncbi:flagellar hook-associated protein FlgL [Cellulomonas sp. KRMCY2]|uniref:flagellar hook-associated protein FlgL n=1 Tax=Cellulomonas sp. KRMCY2 TaxID=1304865 RepID=UPI00045E5FEB|nr:flagellar hook-associated protein FlgL [Cellulomonas sp. KRMCY2]